jgi:hypothetical protein
LFDYYKDDPNSTSNILYGNNERGKVLGFSKVVIAKDITLETILIVETLGYNLISVRQLAICSFDTTFSLHYVKVFRSDNLEVAFVGHVENNLYVVDFSKESTHISTCLMAKADMPWLWHPRHAHVGMRNLKQLLKGEHVVGLPDVSFEKDRPCSACIAERQKEKLHPVMTIISTSRPLELLIWIYLVQAIIIVLVGRDMALLLLTIFQDTLGCVSSSLKKKLTRNSSPLLSKQKEILDLKSKPLGPIMGLNSRTTP